MATSITLGRPGRAMLYVQRPKGLRFVCSVPLPFPGCVRIDMPVLPNYKAVDTENEVFEGPVQMGNIIVEYHFKAHNVALDEYIFVHNPLAGLSPAV